MREIKLYGGEHSLWFRDQDHTYFDKDGNLVANATSVNNVVAKPSLYEWYGRKSIEGVEDWLNELDEAPNFEELFANLEFYKDWPKRYTKQRQMIGSSVHKYIEKSLRYELGLRKSKPQIPDSPEVKAAIRAYAKYRQRAHDLEFLEVERMLYHPENKHCGTADFLGRRSTGFVVGDWKTGSYISPDAALQAASYCKAAEREHGWKFKREIVHINAATGSLSVWDEERIQEKLTGCTVEEDYEQFLRNLETRKWLLGTREGWRFGRE